MKKDQEGLKKGYNWYRTTMPSMIYRELEKKNLKRKIYYMETIIESLGEHLSYMPGGDGYEETKKDYKSKLK